MGGGKAAPSFIAAALYQGTPKQANQEKSAKKQTVK
jgi:hypothetical protein